MPKVKTDHKKWLDVMDDMLKDKRYDFAWNRIEMLRNWVAHNERITGQHIKAIQDIRKKVGDL